MLKDDFRVFVCCVMFAFGLADELLGVEVFSEAKGFSLNIEGVFILEFSCDTCGFSWSSRGVFTLDFCLLDLELQITVLGTAK